MKKMYTVKEILEIAENYTEEYAFVGVRTQEVPFELGSMCHVSHEWDNGEDTGIELDGISVTCIKSKQVQMHASDNALGMFYYGEHVAIVCGDSALYGVDEGERIIKDAVVVEILS